MQITYRFESWKKKNLSKILEDSIIRNPVPIIIINTQRRSINYRTVAKYIRGFHLENWTILYYVFHTRVTLLCITLRCASRGATALCLTVAAVESSSRDLNVSALRICLFHPNVLLTAFQPVYASRTRSASNFSEKRRSRLLLFNVIRGITRWM